MWVLIDYDNVDLIERQRGVSWVVHRILQTITPSYFTDGQQVQIRLYGGWYLGDAHSRLAQDLSAEISIDFPKPIEIFNDEKKIRVRTNAKLALSTLSDPSRFLFHTYRTRGFPGGVKCFDPPFESCQDPSNCPLELLHGFLSSKTCPSDECTIKPKNILYRVEQKMVDSMIVADIIHISLNEITAAIVSSDDDLWPGIRMALNQGLTLHHIHPRRGQDSLSFYRDPAPTNYHEYSLFQ